VVTVLQVFTETSHTVLPQSSSHMSSVHTMSSTLSIRAVTLTETLLSATTVCYQFILVDFILTNRTQHGSRCRRSRIIMYRSRTCRRSLHSISNFLPIRPNLILSLRVRWSRWIRRIRWFQPITQCRYEAWMGYEVPRFGRYCFRRCCCGYGHGCLEGMLKEKEDN
jgi:hypothetical protein